MFNAVCCMTGYEWGRTNLRWAPRGHVTYNKAENWSVGGVYTSMRQHLVKADIGFYFSIL